MEVALLVWDDGFDANTYMVYENHVFPVHGQTQCYI